MHDFKTNGFQISMRVVTFVLALLVTLNKTVMKHTLFTPDSQKFRATRGVTLVATFNVVNGSRLSRKQVTLAPLPASKL